MDNVLLIVDMLNDFISPEGKLFFPKGKTVVAPIVALRDAFRADGAAVVYDNDAHPEDSEEFAAWPPHCVMGTPGARVVDALTPGPGDIVFNKDSLSLFVHTHAEVLLRGLVADGGRLYVAGVATEYCVKEAVLGALERGFAVTVITDAIAGVDREPGDCDRAMAAMREAGAAFASATDVLNRIA
ncbi:isochorismatase hydrolase [Solidesulfovibrio fructosivorans JJ]]|uniref:Isochorismatase hydrolase n=1 Tax=Solidesulfovibrio fructosivorans JJ] TaxID=596151 RepID=E1JZ41_SOLFR|nr:isochorismatase family cysteine hydrolase [Solidesulfovibrio fructosivorans]EFL50324.1 isochorismatase hydrolase [Solidesulfovibrio fructosivorans JJ]]